MATKIWIGIVELAIANNTDLKKSAITVNKALYEANLLGQELVPEFSGSGGASTTTNTKAGETTHNYTAELGVSYELDLWRKLSSAASAQEWEYKADPGRSGNCTTGPDQ